jgi:hypothetical protein
MIQDVSEKWEQQSEQWQIDHHNAMFACDVDQALGEVVRALSFVHDVWERAKRSATARQLPDYYAARDFFAKLFRDTQALCDDVEPMVARVKDLSYSLEYAQDFEDAAHRLAAEQAEIDAHLPRFNRGLMEQSRKDDAEGRTKTVEELLDEFQGEDS